MSSFTHIASIKEVHEFWGLAKPTHPLVTVVPLNDIKDVEYGDRTYVVNLYQISLKEGLSGSFTYGRNAYDFEEGTITFLKPGQAIKMNDRVKPDYVGGWTLIFHPDLIRCSVLDTEIEDYRFFSYEVNEALHLSDEERVIFTEHVSKIKREITNSIDRYSQKLIVSNISILLDYCTRCYDRQFYTRSNLNKGIVSRLEALLKAYFHSGESLDNGVPTVGWCGNQLGFSSQYLSDLVKKETGQNAQQHIHNHVIRLAKNRLLGSTDRISEIAYDLGFSYPQHFSKFFKSKTGMTPAEYRNPD